jgi:hypothetical protein
MARDVVVADDDVVALPLVLLWEELVMRVAAVSERRL